MILKKIVFIIYFIEVLVSIIDKNSYNDKIINKTLLLTGKLSLLASTGCCKGHAYWCFQTGFNTFFNMYTSWLVNRPGRWGGGITGGCTTPLTGSMCGSSLGGGSLGGSRGGALAPALFAVPAGVPPSVVRLAPVVF